MAPLDSIHPDIRDGVRAVCNQFDSAYWQKIDHDRAYPEAFVDALTGAGWLAALIPQEYGGAGLGLSEASVIMEEVNRCGGNAGEQAVPVGQVDDLKIAKGRHVVCSYRAAMRPSSFLLGVSSRSLTQLPSSSTS